MASGGNLVGLSYVLIGLYSGVSDVRALAERAGMVVGNLDLSGPPRTYVWNVVREADKSHRLGQLIDAALQDYPDHADLLAARDHEYTQLTNPVTPPPLPPDRWKPAFGLSRAEKIMGSSSTFLPVSFLALGVACARSVARVVVPEVGRGTGFLIADNILVTNHHVLPDRDAARGAHIEFNYQETPEGRAEQTTEFALDPDGGFLTSPMKGGHDLTLVHVSGDANESWGSLRLATRPPDLGTRVTIVQHPEGGFKKIALHNNLISYIDDDVLQYFTDTMPGSSGSPVFDPSWRVVGVHHAGGDLVEPGTGRQVFRNEGINVAQVNSALLEFRRP